MREVILYKEVEIPPEDEEDEVAALFPYREWVETGETAFFHKFYYDGGNPMSHSPGLYAILEFRDGSCDTAKLQEFKFKHPIEEVEVSEWKG
ncbi:hypothetical protein BE882_14895 [Listeria monocytogenes]|nr:hypothetical protein [Listeria monocytogenes]EAE6437689.1 hypothetical protein [Listeria monocytogenes]EAG4793433.1 hypothetical protein [Listeria monocytogenes]